MSKKSKNDPPVTAAAAVEITEAAAVVESPEAEPVAKPRRMTGEELQAYLRQQRRERRLAEKGY